MKLMAGLRGRSTDMKVLAMHSIFILLCTIPSSPATAQSIDHQKKALGASAQKADSDKRGSEAQSFVIKILPPEKSTDQSKDEERKKHEEPNHETRAADATWALFWVTLVLAIFTGGLFGANYYLLRDSSRAFDAVHRPKFRIRHLWSIGELWDGGTITIKTQVVNVGITQGRITEYFVTTLLLPADQPLPAVPEYGNRIMVNNEPFLGSGMWSNLDPKFEHKRSCSDAENVAIREGKKKLYCFGFVIYADKFGPRTTAFCRLLEPPQGPGSASKIGRFLRLDPPNPDYEYED